MTLVILDEAPDWFKKTKAGEFISSAEDGLPILLLEDVCYKHENLHNTSVTVSGYGARALFPSGEIHTLFYENYLTRNGLIYDLGT